VCAHSTNDCCLERASFKLKFFADGYESELEVGGRKAYAIPMMEGDFVIEHNIGAVDGVAGGNFFILADTQMNGLDAAEKAVEAVMECKGSITPFPGGIVASGSKPGGWKQSWNAKAQSRHSRAGSLRAAPSLALTRTRS